MDSDMRPYLCSMCGYVYQAMEGQRRPGRAPWDRFSRPAGRTEGALGAARGKNGLRRWRHERSSHWDGVPIRRNAVLFVRIFVHK